VIACLRFLLVEDVRAWVVTERPAPMRAGRVVVTES
jgi:hypothetical protein